VLFTEFILPSTVHKAFKIGMPIAVGIPFFKMSPNYLFIYFLFFKIQVFTLRKALGWAFYENQGPCKLDPTHVFGVKDRVGMLQAHTCPIIRVWPHKKGLHGDSNPPY